MEDTVQHLKKVLKQWEAGFQKEHQRKPKREEIGSAPSEIQDAYVKYSQLKKSGKGTQILSQSDPGNSQEHNNSSENDKGKVPSSHDELVGAMVTTQSEGHSVEKQSSSNGWNGKQVKDVTNEKTSSENQAWGKEFDKKITGTVADQEHHEEKSKDIGSDYLQKMSSRLFQNASKLGKPSATKKSVFRKPSHQDMNKTVNQEVVCEPSSTVHDKTVIGKCEERNNSEMSAMTVKGAMFEKALLLTQKKASKSSHGDDDVIIPDKFNVKAKSRFSISVSKHFRNEEDDEQTTGDTDSFSFSCSQMNGSTSNVKYSDVSDSVFDEVDFIKGTHDSQTIRCESVSSQQQVKRTMDRDTVAERRINSNNSDVSFDASDSGKTESITDTVMTECASTKKRQTKSSKNSKSKRFEDLDFSTNQDLDTSQEKTPKARCKKENRGKQYCVQDSPTLQNEESVNNSKSCFDFDEIEEDVPVIPKGGKKRKAAKGASEVKSSESKRRKITDETATTDDRDDMDDDNHGTQKIYPSSRPKASASSSSSGNFIKLNMRVKTYKRKGRGMTGPQYKRFQWKQKMKARSKSYGDKCFKCGQTGHWSNQCQGQKETYGGENDTPPVLEENFLSLKEAAMMARGIKPEKSEVKVKKKKEKPVTSAGTREEEDLEGIDWDAGMDDGSGDQEQLEEELEVQTEIVRSKREVEDVPSPVSPLMDCDDNTDIPASVMSGLKKFGYEQFRHGQEKAVMRILQGKSTLVVLSTGGGKSLCYQLPAYLYAQRSKVITIVISPLVSLMEDQITGLPAGIRGACLHTNMTKSQREGVLSNVKEGKVHFLLVSPEAVAGGGMTLLNNKSSLPPIAFVCIDEAHCLSEWSHNFRPSYLRLTKVLREKFGVQCFLGLTATATKSTASDVARHLCITDLDEAVIRGPAVPRNLLLSVSRDDNRDEALIGLLQGQRFSSCESIIIYCTRREQTDRLATLIRTCLKDEKGENWDEKNAKKKGKKKVYAYWDAESYHAGHSAAQRKRVQNAFMSGRLRVVIATVAFGMGLDKSDVRGVIHYNMPRSFEGYVQEIGRAGRDGKASHCHLFLDSEGQDLAELRKHTYSNTVDYRTLKKFLQKVFPSCRCKQVHQLHREACSEKNKENDLDTSEEEEGKRVCLGHERALCIEQTVMDLDVKEEGISTLLCYLELHPHKLLENMTSVYATCKVQCYGGPSQLQAISKKCPPVAVAIAKAKKDGKSFATSNQIEFPVVDISDCMGWDSGPVKRELKMLSWNFNIPGATGPRKSGVIVEFSNLAFHFRSPGDMSDHDVDDILQFLHERIQKQEKSELGQLKYLYQSLRSVSHKNYYMCSDELDEQKNDKLKSILKDYFSHQELPQNVLQTKEENTQTQEVHQAIADIRQLINIHGHEHKFNGRAIARIFHGIGSPCFPAQVWGRNRRFWRSHMDIDFNLLIKVATQELVRFR